MTHRQVYGKFQETFPAYVHENLIYFPNGKNSVRIRGIRGLHSGGEDFVFSYNGVNDWKLETVDSFIKNTMKGVTANA